MAVSLAGEAAPESQPPSPEAFPTVLIKLTRGGEHYLLLGLGDGKDAFAQFAPEETGPWPAPFEALWKALEGRTPDVEVKAEFDALRFREKEGKTQVTYLGKVLAELEGTEVFAIVTEEKKDTRADVDKDLTLTIWALDWNAGADCRNCGQMMGSDPAHTKLISVFCQEGHTKCMGDPTHHCSSCGRDYPCSQSNGHTRCIKCGKAWCDNAQGGHSELACGHRGCQVYGHQAEHARCSNCKGFLCGGSHGKLACGHYACDTGDHSTAGCGIQGHYACDSNAGKHARCIYCFVGCKAEGDHAPADCQLHCKAQSGDHSTAGCGIQGHWACDRNKDNHVQAACGKHYKCAITENMDQHVECTYCNGCAADGDHAPADCKVHCKAQSGDHSPTGCDGENHWECDSNAGKHVQADCLLGGHWKCDSNAGNHVTAGCGIWGHWECDSNAGKHVRADCGEHYKCGITENIEKHVPCGYCHKCEAEGDHSLRGCKEHCNAQSGDHGTCSTCGGFLCVGQHHNCLGCDAPVCSGVFHTMQPCEVHCYTQGGSNHYRCDRCGGPACNGDHTPHSCGKHCYFQSIDSVHGMECSTCHEFLCSGDHSNCGK